MIKVDFIKKIDCPFTKKKIEEICKLSGTKEKKIKGSVEVNIIGEKEIKEINKNFRGKDKVTDVLSFPWDDKEFLGQIFICCPKIKKQAKEFGVTFKEEFSRMLVHGLLHLVGYDHLNEKDSKEMFKLQEGIVNTVIIKKHL